MLSDDSYEWDDDTRKRYSEKYGWDFKKPWEEQEHMKKKVDKMETPKKVVSESAVPEGYPWKNEDGKNNPIPDEHFIPWFEDYCDRKGINKEKFLKKMSEDWTTRPWFENEMRKEIAEMIKESK